MTNKNIVKSKGIKTAKVNLSYEEYIKSQLEIISKQLSVKSYKLGTEDFPINQKGRDLRIAFVWTKRDEKSVICQFLVEKTFWIMKNTNDADRVWMQRHANVWLDKLRNMVDNTRRKNIKKQPKKKKTMKVGETQRLFDRAKRTNK